MDPCHCSHTRPIDNPAPLPAGYRTGLGDVYMINESICIPFYDIFRQSPNLERTQYIQSSHSLLSVCSRQTATRHVDGRPCILMDYHEESYVRKIARKVCLVTTYSGHQMSTLPKICKEFSIPVSPSDAITAENEDHVHSSPRWSRENAWIIAWVFVTRRPLIRRMQAKREAGRPSENVFFSESTAEYLDAACMKLRTEWMAKCRKDPSLAGRYAKEFHDHRKVFAAAGASNYSLATQATCRTMRHSAYKPTRQNRTGH
ncbi:hypothetical protein K466DRAFT_664992 [Polyporus arcularius HHB13444]|uniref:Uncharacterized protein n=1 Tax=Polyporus arcularius HHB13444 TaxID=1314778 RepID=A0A5C3P6U9_9APHY|nr:hypothetical protein K466DRAFT_664992 [Polyporus arcularius HHB13444]